MEGISPEFQQRFSTFGPGSLIVLKTDINCPEKVAIGRNVLIQENSWFTVVHPGKEEPCGHLDWRRLQLQPQSDHYRCEQRDSGR